MDAAWNRAQQQWIQRAVEQPVQLPGGARVHLVPVGADSPANVSLIRDVVAAVQPDAIAIESPPQYTKSYTGMAKALEPLLERLLKAETSTATSARTALSAEQREAWQAALLQATQGPLSPLRPDLEQLELLFRAGNLPFIEWIIPAHICRTAGPAAAAASRGGSGSAAAPVPLFASCGLDREARAAAAGSFLLGREFDLYLEEVDRALGEELEGEVQAWRAALGDRMEGAGADRSLGVLLSTWDAGCCLGPEQQARVMAAVAERMGAEVLGQGQEAAGGDGGGGAGAGGAATVDLEIVRTPGDPIVARRLLEISEGKGMVRPCKRVVAVVGRSHVLSVEEELLRLV